MWNLHKPIHILFLTSCKHRLYMFTWVTDVTRRSCSGAHPTLGWSPRRRGVARSLYTLHARPWNWPWLTRTLNPTLTFIHLDLYLDPDADPVFFPDSDPYPDSYLHQVRAQDCDPDSNMDYYWRTAICPHKIHRMNFAAYSSQNATQQEITVKCQSRTLGLSLQLDERRCFL